MASRYSVSIVGVPSREKTAPKDLQRLDQRDLHPRPGELPVGEAQQQGTGGPHAGAFRRRCEAEENAAQRREHQRRWRNQPLAELRKDMTHALCAHIFRKRRDRGREQIRHRHFQDRPHDHQHDAGGYEDPQGAARRYRSRGEAHVVVGSVHGLRCHDAEDGHRGTDDARGRSEDRGDEQDGDEQSAVHPGQHQLYRLEEAFHQPRLLHEDAHEYEEGHEIEDQIAEADVAEDEAEKDQGERNGKADEYGKQHASDQKKSEDFGGH
jgi:hypothetical protein